MKTITVTRRKRLKWCRLCRRRPDRGYHTCLLCLQDGLDPLTFQLDLWHGVGRLPLVTTRQKPIKKRRKK